MASWKNSSWPTSRANTWSSSFTLLPSPSSAQQKFWHSTTVLRNSVNSELKLSPARLILTSLTLPGKMLGTSLENAPHWNFYFQFTAINVIMAFCRYCFWWVRFNFLQPMLRSGPWGPKGRGMGTNLTHQKQYQKYLHDEPSPLCLSDVIELEH